MQVPLSQLEMDKVVSILLIYANLGRDGQFVDTFIECSLVYEFDILVNEAENALTKQQQSSKWLSRTYFLQAFFNAIAQFFEKKVPIIDGFISKSIDDPRHQKMLDRI